MKGVIYEFGDFRLDPANHLLSRRDGTPVPLTPRVFDTLLFLVEHHGKMLDKERLMEAVWPDSIVEENNLTQNISRLRQVFGEKPGEHRFVVTVPGRGYRFAADVTTRNGIAQDTEPAGPERDAQPVQPQPGSESKVAPASGFGRRAVIGALVIIALVAGLFLLRGQREQHPRSSATIAAPINTLAQKSIAVLPFQNLSSDAENAYFADGVQDEILTRLAKVADLKVISRMSVQPYKDKPARNLSEIAQQLGVAHLLEGSVQRVGNRVRENAQLIATRTGSHEWAETYDRDLADVFAIQTEIAQAIADQLQAKISAGEKAAMAQAPTTDLVANALYQQARALKSDEPLAALEVVRLLDQAVARDRGFVLAYCLLARVHTGLYHGGYDHTPARRELANVALQNASRLDPEAGEVHLAWARYYYYGFRDYDRARAELDLARRTLPNDAEVPYLNALLDRRQGRWSEAIRNAERAVELDPRNSEHLVLAGGNYLVLRRYSDCRPLIERALRVDPHDLNARIVCAKLPFWERADLRPLRKELLAILAEEPAAAAKICRRVVPLRSRRPRFSARRSRARRRAGRGHAGRRVSYFTGMVRRPGRPHL